MTEQIELAWSDGQTNQTNQTKPNKKRSFDSVDETNQEKKQKKQNESDKLEFLSFYVNSEGREIFNNTYKANEAKMLAHRIFSKFYKQPNFDPDQTLLFGLIEKKDQSEIKYYFSGKRTTLTEPIEVSIGGKIVTFCFVDDIKFVKSERLHSTTTNTTTTTD